MKIFGLYVFGRNKLNKALESERHAGADHALDFFISAIKNKKKIYLAEGGTIIKNSTIKSPVGLICRSAVITQCTFRDIKAKSALEIKSL